MTESSESDISDASTATKDPPSSAPGFMTASGMGVDAPKPSGPDNGNHALQEYQMQLMLPEQQSKKRLLMAG